jgi:hypothetical protein
MTHLAGSAGHFILRSRSVTSWIGMSTRLLWSGSRIYQLIVPWCLAAARGPSRQLDYGPSRCGPQARCLASSQGGGVPQALMRSLESGRRFCLREFEAHCLALKEAVTQDLIDLAPLQAARRLQDVAVALAKEDLCEQLEQLHTDLPDLVWQGAERRRGRVMQILKSFSSGKSGHGQKRGHPSRARKDGSCPIGLLEGSVR